MNIRNIAIAFAISTVGAAYAQTPPPTTPKLDKREAAQEQRIDQGVTSGQLTAKEAHRLDTRATQLAAHEAAAKSDGTLTPAERRKLQREAKRDSAAIYRQKHDKQTAN